MDDMDEEAKEIWENIDQDMVELYQNQKYIYASHQQLQLPGEKMYWLYEYKTRFQNKVKVPIPPLQSPSSNREEYMEKENRYLPMCGEGNAAMHYVDGWYNLHDGEISPGPGYLRVKARLEGISSKDLHASGKE